jgi:hypothetical protein
MTTETNSGFFGEFDVASAADDPFAFRDGTYVGAISNVKVLSGTSKAGDPYRAFVPVLTPESGGASYEHWFGLPVPNTPPNTAERMRSALKGFLLGLEIPESKINTLDPNELIGTPVRWTVKTVQSRKDASKTFKNFNVWLARGASAQNGAVKESGLDVFAQASDRANAVKDVVGPDEFGI